MDKIRTKNLQKSLIVSKITKDLDELDDKIRDSFNCLGYAIVKTDDISVFIQKLKTELPEELEHSAKILSDKDAIIEEAKEKGGQIVDRAIAEAEAIIEEARSKSEEMVSETYVMKKATEQAASIVAEASEQAKNAINYANNYAEGAFDSILKGIEYLRDDTSKAKKQITEKLSDIENSFTPQEEAPKFSKKDKQTDTEDDEFSGYM